MNETRHHTKQMNRQTEHYDAFLFMTTTKVILDTTKNIFQSLIQIIIIY